MEEGARVIAADPSANAFLPTTCCTGSTRCGSWGMATEICPLTGVFGCPIRERRVRIYDDRELVE